MERSFPRELSSLDPLFQFTGEFSQQSRLDAADEFALNLAVEEIFTNMVKYGAGDARVAVALRIHGNDLVIELKHPGAVRFDLSAVPDVDILLPLEQREPGGIGLYLVRRVMDQIAYTHDAAGARVTLRKHLGGS